MDEMFFHQLAQLILARPKKEAKRLARELLAGCEQTIQSGWMKPEETHSFRKSLNGAIQKEIKMIFHPDFSKAESQHVDNNRRFFTLLEQERTVDYVEAVHDPYSGFVPVGEDSAFFDLLQVTDPERPYGLHTVSLPVPVFIALIGDPIEVKADDEGADSRAKVKAFIESKGIEIGYIKKRAGFNDLGFFNELWSNHQFCLIYVGVETKNQADWLHTFILLDCEALEYWRIKVVRSEGGLTVEEEGSLLQSLHTQDIDGDITKEDIFDIFEGMYGRDPRFWAR